jgi:hypothetical protein
MDTKRLLLLWGVSHPLARPRHVSLLFFLHSMSYYHVYYTKGVTRARLLACRTSVIASRRRLWGADV